MRVLVTFAVEAEFAPWRKLRTLEQSSISGVVIYKAQIGRAQVDFVATGMGVESAYRITEAVITEPYQFCITSGFAGALRETHSVGDILAADAVQMIGNSKTQPCSRNLVFAARQDGATEVKLFLTADHVVRTVEEKKQLQPFADAVEMESFGVLSAANARKVPGVAIRVISDSARHDLPAVVNTAVDEFGRVSVSGVVRYIARHPLQLPALVRLGRDSRTAAEALAHFLEAYIKKLSFFTHGRPPEELREVAAR
jgi:nucleoside phosphorylase